MKVEVETSYTEIKVTTVPEPKKDIRRVEIKDGKATRIEGDNK